jgi:hypothetical protein
MEISGVSFQLAVRKNRKLEAYATEDTTIIFRSLPKAQRADTFAIVSAFQGWPDAFQLSGA